MIELTTHLPPPYRNRYQWREGDRLARLDGRPLQDILDLYFYQPDDEAAMLLTVRRLDGQIIEFSLPAEALSALTIAFAPMEFRRCACNCIFCFVEQNPPGMRPAIYVKDEDYRFSFLYGNYITLTSLGKKGIERIIGQRLSPLYVSVHCTDNEVRARMLGLKASPDACAILRELADCGIELHTQIVLCPGWNDGLFLERSFHDLFALRRSEEKTGGVASLVIVPVGLTAHRGGLFPLDPVTPAIAASVIDQVAPWQQRAAAIWGGPFLHLSDEFYFLSERPFPPEEHYADFPQIDNGAGLTRRLQSLWYAALERALTKDRRPRRPLTILTGTLAARALERDLLPALVRAGLPAVGVVPVDNAFYGSSVTVAGLLTGSDLRRALLALPSAPKRTVCLSARAFNGDGLTLDGMTLADLAADQAHEVHVPDEEGFIDWWVALDEP